jgi:hypothetical protein
MVCLSWSPITDAYYVDFTTGCEPISNAFERLTERDDCLLLYLHVSSLSRKNAGAAI